jgi:hypothetical protein
LQILKPNPDLAWMQSFPAGNLSLQAIFPCRQSFLAGDLNNMHTFLYPLCP